MRSLGRSWHIFQSVRRRREVISRKLYFVHIPDDRKIVVVGVPENLILGEEEDNISGSRLVEINNI